MSCIQEQPTEGVRPNAREKAGSDPRPSVRIAEVLIAVSTSRLFCKRTVKTRTLMPVWDSLENLGSKLDDRAVLDHESAGGSDLVEMGEHDRIHVSEHDPPRVQVRKPRLEHVPADMAGQFAGIGEAFDKPSCRPG
jgi:hypothetical protein